MSQAGRCTGRDSNQGPPKYKSRTLLPGQLFRWPYLKSGPADEATGHDHFLPHSLQLNIHYSSCHWTPPFDDLLTCRPKARIDVHC
jgi:hypothetical protein